MSDHHTRDYGDRVIARLPLRASTDLELAAVAGQQPGITLPAETVRQLCTAYLEAVLDLKESVAARARLFDQLALAERQLMIVRNQFHAALGSGGLYARQNSALRLDIRRAELEMGRLEGRIAYLEGRTPTRPMDWDRSEETDVVCVDNLDGPTVDRTPTRPVERRPMAAEIEAR